MWRAGRGTRSRRVRKGPAVPSAPVIPVVHDEDERSFYKDWIERDEGAQVRHSADLNDESGDELTEEEWAKREYERRLQKVDLDVDKGHAEV